jgi:hypothetical protein
MVRAANPSYRIASHRIVRTGLKFCGFQIFNRAGGLTTTDRPTFVVCPPPTKFRLSSSVFRHSVNNNFSALNDGSPPPPPTTQGLFYEVIIAWTTRAMVVPGVRTRYPAMNPLVPHLDHPPSTTARPVLLPRTPDVAGTSASASVIRRRARTMMTR